jgi:5'(3')-deoxyribonucleotidase
MKNKNLIHSDIAIDDRIDNLQNADEKYLMNAWHNRKISEEELKEKGIVRVYTWQDILKQLDY